MKEYFYDQILANYKLLEEEYNYITRTEHEELFEDINKNELGGGNDEQYNRK
jgi:hypothetical protein